MALDMRKLRMQMHAVAEGHRITHCSREDESQHKSKQGHSQKFTEQKLTSARNY
jgi:ribosomal protein L21